MNKNKRINGFGVMRNDKLAENEVQHVVTRDDKSNIARVSK